MKIPQWREFYAIVKMATFDAAPSLGEPIIGSNLIDFTTIKEMEKDMEQHERLGCLFFLIDDYSSGYKKILNIEDDELCLSKFLGKNIISDWEDKVLEALCLLQNNEILIKLGIKPDHAKIHFSTNVREYSVKINKHAKALYILFESLSKDQAGDLLSRVYRDITLPDCQNWPKKVSLELHLLWWIENGFIKVSEDAWGLERLLKILKELGMSGCLIYETLREFDTRNNENSSFHLDDQGRNVTVIRPRTISNIDTPKENNTPKEYKMNNGLVIIFNQVNFTGCINWDKRDGSDEDCRRIEETFGNIFGFETKKHTDLNKNEIYSVLEGLDSQGKRYDCVIVFILSHGTYGKVIAADGAECPIDDIKDKLCITALEDKPKMLVIQACQTSENALGTDGPKNKKERKLKRFEDTVVLNSTILGERAVRDRFSGTWFITALCKVLDEMQGESILDCFTEVCNRFKSKGAYIEGELITQVPLVESTLAKKLFFRRRAGAASG